IARRDLRRRTGRSREVTRRPRHIGDHPRAGAPKNMTEPFARYDSRRYRTIDAAAGYAAWAPFYDATMDGRLDLPLLGSLASLDWSAITAAVDLGCGTRRIG